MPVFEQAGRALPPVKLNPRRASRIAEATGSLAKTDRIDAAMLARMAAMLKPDLRPAKTDRIDAAMLARMAATLKPDLRPVKSEALAQLSELIDEASTALINANPDLKARYDQLIAAGKPAKLAITAIMRKLVVMANALLRENRPCAETRP